MGRRKLIGFLKLQALCSRPSHSSTEFLCLSLVLVHAVWSLPSLWPNAACALRTSGKSSSWGTKRTASYRLLLHRDKERIMILCIKFKVICRNPLVADRRAAPLALQDLIQLAIDDG